MGTWTRAGTQSWSERRHGFALSSAVVVTFNHKEILIIGKVHIVQQQRQICSGKQGPCKPEFTPSTWATRKQRT